MVFLTQACQTPVVAFVFPTRDVEQHLIGSVSSAGVVLWHSLIDGRRFGEHPFAIVQTGMFKRLKHSDRDTDAGEGTGTQ